MANELTTKFVRAHAINQSVSSTVVLRWIHKLIYEFWGFCVNGTDSLTVPGGFASSGIIAPTNFQSGSTLMASGSDGVTVAGAYVFQASSVNWTSGTNAFVGKHIVTWKSGSESTDDSVYLITKIVNSSSIMVDITNGGTPFTGSLKPAFTARTNINFRVIDIPAAVALSGYTADNDGFVLSLNGAFLVNSGQIAPQVRTRIRTSVGSNVPNIGLTLSSSGSWTATSASSGNFSDGSAEVNADSSGTGWGTGTGTGYVTLIGAQDFLLCHSRGSWNTAGASGFHIEVPKRLYSQNCDPMPVVAMNFGQAGLTVTSTTQGYGGGLTMFHPPDGSTRKWRSMIRNPVGDYFNSAFFSSNSPGLLTTGRSNEMFFNQYTNKFIMFDLVLGLPSVTFQYSALRVRLRRMRWTANIIPSHTRLGNRGEWLHVHNGVLWPWDNAVLPYNLFLGGF